jgi:hypothetical protein
MHWINLINKAQQNILISTELCIKNYFKSNFTKNDLIYELFNE